MNWIDCILIVVHDVLLVLQAGPDENLKDVALKILQTGVATVPIIHSSSEDGSYPQLLHLASLSDILKCKLFFFIISFLSNDVSSLLTDGTANFQVFAGTLDILLVLCPYFSYQFVQFLWAHGSQKLENKIFDH